MGGVCLIDAAEDVWAADDGCGALETVADELVDDLGAGLEDEVLVAAAEDIGIGAAAEVATAALEDVVEDCGRGRGATDETGHGTITDWHFGPSTVYLQARPSAHSKVHQIPEIQKYLI